MDELNAAIGLAVIALGGAEPNATLQRIQNDLFDLGADLATPGEDFTPGPMALRIVSRQIDWLEAAIDTLNAGLPPLASFILPGGSQAAAALHLARTVARRAERAAVTARRTMALNPLALIYLNRLSDYLFVAARFVNAGADPLWVPGGSAEA